MYSFPVASAALVAAFFVPRPAGRNCGKTALQCILTADASTISRILAFSLAASARRTLSVADFPQLRPRGESVFPVSPEASVAKSPLCVPKCNMPHLSMGHMLRYSA